MLLDLYRRRVLQNMKAPVMIAHRGNVVGPDPANENNPRHIDAALSAGFDAEIDVWHTNNRFYLGHDNSQHVVELEYLKNPSLWCHAKSLKTLEVLLEHDIHCFWHQTDDFTITSAGYIWTFPQKPVGPKSVIVCKTEEETVIMAKGRIAGICSDYVGLLK